MPYPAKTDRAAILAEAVVQLERDGMRALSLRGLASSLGLAPNALYRYFTDRAALESALTAESTRKLHIALQIAVAAAPEAHAAIRALSLAYLEFARAHPHLYAAMMVACPSGSTGDARHDELWNFVGGQVARLAAPHAVEGAAIALWAFLHGMVALEAAGVFREAKSDSSFDFGLSAWFDAAIATKTPRERTA